jgi:YesN/AraC family two-component response regulator
MEEKFEVAVIDDEEWARRGLVCKLNKSGLPIKAIHEFCDSEPLLRYIEEGGAPDVMLCDIRMPGIDGLSLSALVKKRLPSARVIIISGYGEFEYAKRAIQAGVSDYLLKPIDSLELLVAIKNSMDAISLSRRNRERMTYLGMIEREHRARRYVVRGEAQEGLSDLFPAYGKDSTAFICAYFRVPHLSELAVHELVNQQGLALLEQNGIANSVLYSPMPEEYALLFLAIEPFERIKAFTRTVALRLGDTAAAGLSGVRDSVEVALMEAIELMKYRILVDCPSPVCTSDVCRRVAQYDIPGHYVSALRYALEENNEKTLTTVLHSLEEEIAAEPLSYRSLEKACLQILTPLNEAQPAAVFIKDPYQFGTLAALFTFLRDAYLACIKPAESNNSKVKMIRAIAASIDEHFSEYVTLEGLATNYGINTCYLSILFKEVIGIHFQEYLSQARIRNAKQLLATGRFSVGEVAEKAGYTSRFYFSKAFKKIEGLTPSEFKNLAGK